MDTTTTAPTHRPLGHVVGDFLRGDSPSAFTFEDQRVTLELDGDVVMLTAVAPGVDTVGVTSAALGARALVDLLGLPSTTPVAVG